MEDVKINLRASFNKYLEENRNYWRISRISTFIDLIVVEVNKNEQNPSSTYFENIFNYLLSAKINSKLGTVSIPENNLRPDLEDIVALFQLASQIIDEIFYDIKNKSFDEDFNLYKDVNYLKFLTGTLENSNDFEMKFIDKTLSKVVVQYIKEYFK